MKKIYLKCFIAIVMAIGSAVNVMAVDFTPFTEEQKEEAVAALQKKCNEAGALVSGSLMTKEKKEQLQKAKIDGDQVWDRAFDQIKVEEINRVMPVLLDAMEKAEASIEECKKLASMVVEFLEKEKAENEKAFNEYESNPTVIDALDKLYNQYGNVEGFFKLSDNITDAMVEAANSGKDMREILAIAKIELPTVEETVKAAGIDSVENTGVNNDTEYSLAGMKVNSNYRGLVIRGGKKIIRR